LYAPPLRLSGSDTYPQGSHNTFQLLIIQLLIGLIFLISPCVTTGAQTRNLNTARTFAKTVLPLGVQSLAI
jgi:hypothetical protein